MYFFCQILNTKIGKLKLRVKSPIWIRDSKKSRVFKIFLPSPFIPCALFHLHQPCLPSIIMLLSMSMSSLFFFSCLLNPSTTHNHPLSHQSYLVVHDQKAGSQDQHLQLFLISHAMLFRLNNAQKSQCNSWHQSNIASPAEVNGNYRFQVNRH